MRPTDAELSNILTDADREDIVGSLPAYVQGKELEVKHAVRRIAGKVWDFAHSAFGCQVEEPLWLGTILERLSDERFTFPAVPKGRRMTREFVLERFEDRYTDALEEDKAWWEQSPDDYRKYRHRDYDGTHPWGEAIVKRCRGFLAIATPYRVWKLMQTVQTRGQEALQDDLLTMAACLGGGETAVRLACERAFDDEIAALIEELETAKAA